MIIEDFPFATMYDRTRDWWGRDWRILSDWCNESYGVGGWEYYDNQFRFKTDQDRVLFILRWHEKY